MEEIGFDYRKIKIYKQRNNLSRKKKLIVSNLRKTFKTKNLNVFFYCQKRKEILLYEKTEI